MLFCSQASGDTKQAARAAGVKGMRRKRSSVCTYRICRCISHPSGAVFQARTLDNQEGEGANTERREYVFGKLSARHVFNADLLGSDTIPTAVELSTIGNRLRGA